jgi:hypothetical protein
MKTTRRESLLPILYDERWFGSMSRPVARHSIDWQMRRLSQRLGYCLFA